jgi:hypothetical protein
MWPKINFVSIFVLNLKSYNMKKIYSLLLIALSSLSFGQFYEGFNYNTPGNIGGATTTTSDATGSNNWLTQSNTLSNSGTIDIIAGNLSYTGIATSTGNKILLPGSNSTVPRDINRAFTMPSSSTVLYYSALINVIDNTQLVASPIATGNTNSYFMSFGSTAGTNVNILNGRLAAATVNSGANYRLQINNNSSGTVSNYSEFTTDLNFGTTYLVVVKVDITTSPYMATLWVNPSTLGGTEPAGSISNNTGTNSTATTFGSVVLRNASATAKVEIDEIKVGLTYASVTAADFLSSNSFSEINGLKMYPNPAKNNLFIETALNSDINVAIIDVLGKEVINSKVSNNAVTISGLTPGMYIVKITEEGKTSTKKLIIE